MKLSEPITINAPINKVWDILTDESKLSLWAAGQPQLSYSDGTRRADPTGQAFILSFPNVGRPREVRGEFLSFSPPSQLTMRFHEKGISHLVTYALHSDGSFTIVEYTSDTESQLDPPRFLRGIVNRFYSWLTRKSLNRLKRLVEAH